ncbi:MAG: enoyl-CoA hydratase/isomerase family protein [Planctomycetes bacterium]|nr:enoyl-CoA hydratase/isomerase family protein [Planctomycetota bacterium]
MDEPIVKLERDGALARVTLNRPERRNALDKAMIDALHGVLDTLAEDDSVGAMILAGAGDKAFAAGADIAQLRDRRRREALLSINSRLFQRLEETPYPTIAAIRGFCLGGGSELALACDLRIAGESARFGQPEVSLGIVPGAGATYRLPRAVGAAKARELIFTGRILDGREALRIGLVNELVPDGEVDAAASRMAADILKQDRLAVRFAKLLFRLDGSARPGAGYIGEAMAQAVLFESEEKVRRMTEFLERKR